MSKYTSNAIARFSVAFIPVIIMFILAWIAGWEAERGLPSMFLVLAIIPVWLWGLVATD